MYIVSYICIVLHMNIFSCIIQLILQSNFARVEIFAGYIHKYVEFLSESTLLIICTSLEFKSENNFMSLQIKNN